MSRLRWIGAFWILDPSHDRKLVGFVEVSAYGARISRSSVERASFKNFQGRLSGNDSRYWTFHERLSLRPCAVLDALFLLVS